MNGIFTINGNLSEDQIFDYVHGYLSPEERIVTDLHLLDSPEDQGRIDVYRKWRKYCEDLRKQFDDQHHGFNVVYHDFSSDEMDDRLAADDTIPDEFIKPFCGILEQRFKETVISGVRLKVTLSQYKDNSVWLKLEGLEPSPAHRRFRIGIGQYRGEAVLDGDHPPCFESELPSSAFSALGNVLIQLQPTDE